MDAYAELHCHTSFSFLDGASAPDELAERALELGLAGLGITDHQGLYGAVRGAAAYEEAGLRVVLGTEVELRDPVVPDPDQLVIPARRRVRRGGRRTAPGAVGDPDASAATEGEPDRPRPERTRLPGHRDAVKEDVRGIGERQRGPHLVLLARDATGYRSLCRLVSRANLAGTKAMPRFDQALLVEHVEGLVALSGCREGEIARRLRAGDREGARAAASVLAERYGRDRFHLELSHHRLPDDDWLVTETAALAGELRLPVVVTNDVHYARPEGREFQDVLTAIRHGRTLDTLADLRRPDGESFLKSAAEMRALPPGDGSLGRDVARAWSAGIARAVELAASCRVDLGFEQYRFPGFPVPRNETPFSYLSELCWEGARRRYHPMTAAVVNRLAHELDVIERAGLAEFFLICWDLMRYAKEQGIPAQGRGSATSSIVSYTLGISRVEPIAHNLLFERFINEGRTTYPDVDIDFSSERREEVIQYIYNRYGPEHTAMVCNLVTYRARSAVREIGVALGFPRPLVDRVAKALETYDSVMVRRDLEADGGFAEFFRRPDEDVPPEARAAAEAEGRGLVDGMGQLNTRVPLVGKVPPWRQPPQPVDPDAPRPFGWLHDTPVGPEAGVLRDAGGLADSDLAVAAPSSVVSRGLDGAQGTAPSPGIADSALGHARPHAESSASTVPAARTSAGAQIDAANDRGDPSGARFAEPVTTPSLPHALGGPQEGSDPSADAFPALGHASADPSGDASGSVAAAGNDGIATRGRTRATALPDALAPRTAIRASRHGDDEGGPGDTPASVAWLREGRGTGYAADRERLIAPALLDDGRGGRRAVDPESGMPETEPRSRRIGRRIGRPIGSAGQTTGTPRRRGRERWAVATIDRAWRESSPSRRRRPAADPRRA